MPGPGGVAVTCAGPATAFRHEQHHTLTPEEQREAPAHTLARELTRGATWDGVAGLKEQGLVRSAHEGRALLREYALDWAVSSRRLKGTLQFRARQLHPPR
jgi:hypothetical protein